VPKLFLQALQGWRFPVIRQWVFPLETSAAAYLIDCRDFLLNGTDANRSSS